MICEGEERRGDVCYVYLTDKRKREEERKDVHDVKIEHMK